MSSMLKKKGGLVFKPKAPGLKRNGAAASAAGQGSSAVTTPTPAPAPAPPAPLPAASPSPIPAPAPAPARVSSSVTEPAVTPSHPPEDGPPRSVPPRRAAPPSTPVPKPVPERVRTRRSSRSAAAAAAAIENQEREQREKAQKGREQEPAHEATEGNEVLGDAEGGQASTRIAISSLLQNEAAAVEQGRSEAAAAESSKATAATVVASRAKQQVFAPPRMTAAATRSRRFSQEMSIQSVLGEQTTEAERADTQPPQTEGSQSPLTPATTQGDVTDSSTATPAPPATRKRARARHDTGEEESPASPADLSETTSTDAPPTAVAAATKKRQYRRLKPYPSNRKRSAAKNGDSSGATSTTSTTKRSRRERSVTPEDAENQTVNHRELKMEDLTKDLRIGKKFSRHDELVDRLREKRRLYRQSRLQQSTRENTAALPDNVTNDDVSSMGAGSSERGTPQPPSSSTGQESAGPSGGQSTIQSDMVAAAASVIAAATGASASLSTPKVPNGNAAVAGPQFEIIDGAIVVNQASLVHDRHAAAAAEAGELEEIEENDFTRQTTSNTYLKPGKLRGPNTWTDAETTLFYRALSMFGTSFDLIANWFPGKSRRHIKMKFNREDRANPDKITAALVGQHKVAIDVEEYMARTGQTLSATETIDAEYTQRQAEHDAEQKRLADEAAEALQKKREALFGSRRPAAADNDHPDKNGKEEVVEEVEEVEEIEEVEQVEQTA